MMSKWAWFVCVSSLSLVALHAVRDLWETWKAVKT